MIDFMSELVKQKSEPNFWNNLGSLISISYSFITQLQVYTNGNPYGIAEDIVFSMPCRSKVTPHFASLLFFFYSQYIAQYFCLICVIFYSPGRWWLWTCERNNIRRLPPHPNSKGTPWSSTHKNSLRHFLPGKNSISSNMRKVLLV